MNVKGSVYFIKHTGLSPVKIGYSSAENPIARLYSMTTYAPYGVELLGFIQTLNAKQLERKLHKKYKNKRLNGEWFELTNEDIAIELQSNTKFENVRLKTSVYFINWANDLYKKYEGERLYNSCIYKNYITFSGENISPKKFKSWFKIYFKGIRCFVNSGRDAKGRYLIISKII